MSEKQLELVEQSPYQADDLSFIEVQFPVSKISKESYSERKGAQGQTLTGLGKWWGRKPLVLVRAVILGLLLPSTDDPEADREVFLALMTMDDDGMLRRLDGSIPARELFDLLPPGDRDAFETTNGRIAWKRGVSSEERRRLQRRAFLGMSYDSRLKYCKRPEEVDGPSDVRWERINAFLGTTALSLPELVRELGERRFGHVPRIGDAFSGGGSIPFEAARVGCDAYASDINPVAALLTWGALNVVGGGPEAVNRVKTAQHHVFKEVERQVDGWGIERNELGWIADAYLYCTEVHDPTTGWRVPLAPSWIVAARAHRVIAQLLPVPHERRFDIEIVEGVSQVELQQAALEGTITGGVRSPVDRYGNWIQVTERSVTSIEQLRGSDGLRRWENVDLVPRPDDVFGERLYCIRWFDPATGLRHYRVPNECDVRREELVLQLLQARVSDWQSRAIVPSLPIQEGQKTDEPIRTRGWTHWHHLFNPRQLLLLGLLSEQTARADDETLPALTLLLGRMANWNSRLTQWDPSRDQGKQTFYNQALNTLYNYSTRPFQSLGSLASLSGASSALFGKHQVVPRDARAVEYQADVWITDPGYGDVVVYDELSEFFLSWYQQGLKRRFPNWYTDSKRALNVRGEGETFRLALAECYQNLARHLPSNGFQVVMFTHQDPELWADVGLTLWSAGLQVSAAWTVVTETPTTGVKGGGNYVQGTVLLVLRKRSAERRGHLGDLYPDIQAEVKRQIESMLALDDKEEPNFGDADYQLAAYAAALRVLTSYSSIDEIDVQRELRRQRARGETSPLAKLIGQAVRIASDYLVPDGLDRGVWRKLGPEERLYLKGIETEAGGEAREGVYQELARGYGAGPHRELYASRTANRVRFKTASEFAGRDLGRIGEDGFRGTLLRQLLFAVYETASDPERDPRNARRYLRQELSDYWQSRLHLVELLRFLGNRVEMLPHWRSDLDALRLLQGSLENDSV